MSGTAQLTVRFFAAAQAAAGTESDVIDLKTGATVDDVVRELSNRSAQLARVLRSCSYLCDGVAVRDCNIELQPGQTLDVLPPFAGG